MFTPKSFFHLIKELRTENDCRQFLEDLRWKGEPVCPHCGSKTEKHYKLKIKGIFKGLYKCKDCRKRFTVTTGTMFQSTHIPLEKWLFVICMFTGHKSGTSSVQLAKDIGVTQKTAWYILGRIRDNFGGVIKVLFGDMTQVDETYIGGKNNKKNYKKRKKGTQGRSTKIKTPVMGLRNSDGLTRTIVIPDTKGNTLKFIIDYFVPKGSTVITDGWVGYKGLSKEYIHEVVDHSTGQYVRGKYHTNGIENFWSQLKRGIIGVYRSVSIKHLQKYCEEFEYRYNTRRLSDIERFNLLLVNANKRLKYKELIDKNYY